MNSKAIYKAAVVVALACGILPCLGYAAEINNKSTNTNEISESSSTENESSEAITKASEVSESDASEAGTSESPFSVSVGFDRSSGKYGSNRTSNSLSVPVTLSYDTDNYGFALTASYLRQTGPAGTFAGSRVRPVGVANPIVSESGFGDITGSVTRYLISDDETGISVDLKGEIKFATANQNRGLGTGKNDYSAEATVNKDYTTFGMSGTLGYSVLGSPGSIVINGIQQNIILHNIFYGSVGAMYNMSESTKAELVYNKQQAPEIGEYQQKDITATLNFKLNKEKSLHIYVLRGLAKGSPDWGSGASVSTSF
jgi:hypothetical protein